MMRDQLPDRARRQRKMPILRVEHWMKHSKKPGWFRIPCFVYNNLINGGMFDGEHVAEVWVEQVSNGLNPRRPSDYLP
jgi:hypothetical protein